jgi:hypothetical protein
MKIAIMQPYFFPYIGYFQLINTVDRFIIGDEVQYIHQGWINRNRILKPEKEGFCYIHIPLKKHSFKTLIKDIYVVEGNDWKDKILRQLEHYKKKAPFYNDVRSLMQDSFTLPDTSIVSININCLKQVCTYLGIDNNIEVQSLLNLDYSNVHNKEDRVIKICKQLCASEYINPFGGSELYQNVTFNKSGIKLNFLHPLLKPYDQFRQVFEPGLSIIDVMMFNSPMEIKQMLNSYQLL